MLFGSLHVIDVLVIVGYLALVIYFGQRASAASRTEEGFFLAGRRLGRLYQFFLNFGNATEPQGAVSTASLVYQRGVTGVWFTFQTIFMNPYFWFMNTWFRRVRLVTSADLFEDRFGSRGLSRLYALSQVGVACVFLGFGNFVAYKIASSLVVKPESAWTASDRASVEGYRALKALETRLGAGTLPEVARPQLAALRDRQARGELASYVTLLDSWWFYVGFTLVVGAYIVLGGMAAAALNEALQSLLIIVFSILLVPTGLQAIGGWGELARKVPHQMVNLFAGEGGSLSFIVAVLFVSLVQIHGLSHHMGIFGSARNELAARVGVTGNYLKRFMIILWAFAGLIAIALFGVGGLADPDVVWGALSHRLLGPGLIGLMLAGVLAGTMSTLAAKALAISSLFVRNVYRHLKPDASAAQAVRAARWTIVAVLALGVVSAELMSDIESIVKLVLTVNVPFGAAIMTLFFWRRLTAPAVWASVLLTVLAILVLPLVAGRLPGLRRAPELAVATRTASGEPVPVYWRQLVRTHPADPGSPLEGVGRFSVELWTLRQLGLNPTRLTPSQREAATFYFDGLLPFLLLLAVSVVTPPTDRRRTDLFYGKMKTPVGATPELEAEAMAETARHPDRFDHLKLWRNSSWEFCRWDRVDTIGFLVCCATSAAIIGIFLLLLHAAA